MTTRRFHIVDVFAEEKYAGNQLAVIEECNGLDTDTMQRIARETNFSETTFLTGRTETNGGYDVRIFTPGAEIPFAGHPTLGTAWVIRHHLIQQPRERIVLNLGVGQIPVTFAEDHTGEVLWMRQRPPEFGEPLDAERAARVLSLQPSQLDTRFPVQEVSTGIPFLIVPVRELAAVREATLDPQSYKAWLADDLPPAIFFFCPQAVDAGNDVHSRMFAPTFGVPEDPATGSANGCLAGYLVKHQFYGKDAIDLRVEQGYQIQRKSLLRLRANATVDSIEINVGGRVFPSARGEFV